jgi:D-glycero-D-manno-heptose 1,7-bisphosphate phosphatase
MLRKFVILDRDGTLVEERHHLTDPSQLSLIRGVGEALMKLTKLGLGLVVVTNQSPVGRGMLTLEKLELIHVRLRTLLSEFDISLNGIYSCPHTPEDDCSCRKPRTGLVDKAASDLGFDPAAAFLVGDNISDVELGRRVGAATFLVRTGHGRNAEPTVGARADYVVDDLPAAVSVIEYLIVHGISRRVNITRQN